MPALRGHSDCKIGKAPRKKKKLQSFCIQYFSAKLSDCLIHEVYTLHRCRVPLRPQLVAAREDDQSAVLRLRVVQVDEDCQHGVIPVGEVVVVLVGREGRALSRRLQVRLGQL